MTFNQNSTCKIKSEFNYNTRQLLISLEEIYNVDKAGDILSLLDEKRLTNIDKVVVDCLGLKAVQDIGDEIFLFHDKFNKELFFISKNAETLKFFNTYSRLTLGKPIEIMNSLEDIPV